MDIKDRLTNYLNEKDITIADAAKACRVSPGTISKIIRGRTNPNRRTVYKIKKFVGDTE